MKEISKATLSIESVSRHVLLRSGNQVGSQSQVLQKREVLSMGFTKGMGPFGGCIIFCFFLKFSSCERDIKSNFIY